MKVVLGFILIHVVASNWNCANYYWRDYYGTTPKDAFPAGKDAQGNAIYVGLVYIQGYEYLPATIYPLRKAAVASAYGKSFTQTKNVQILCSPDPEGFQWTSIKSEDLDNYIGGNLIPGGSEIGENLFIGRTNRDGGYIIGKIFRNERPNRGLGYAYKNASASVLSYDVLSFECCKICQCKA